MSRDTRNLYSLLLLVSLFLLLSLDHFYLEGYGTDNYHINEYLGKNIIIKEPNDNNEVNLNDLIEAVEHLNDGYCHRKCPSNETQRNTIVYHTYFGGGLEDRATVLRQVSELGAFLCARVYVPMPSQLLATKHNNKSSLKKSLRWNDFISYKTLQGEDIIYDYDVNTVDNFIHDKHNLTTLWITTNSSDVASHFDSALASSLQANHTKFIWIIKHNNWFEIGHKLQHHIDIMKKSETSFNEYISSDDSLRHPIIGIKHGFRSATTCLSHDQSCLYVNCKSTFSESMKNLGTILWKSLIIDEHNQNRTNIGLMHVRRGDASDDCDTSLEKMQQRISCTFDVGIKKTDFQVTLLFATDETNTTYIRSIQDMFTKLGYIKFIHLDKVAQNILLEHSNYDNNYHVYWLIQYLYEIHHHDLLFTMNLRRTFHCPDCQYSIRKKYQQLIKL